MNHRALVAMSGGVDSSVAALLTKNMGMACVGCTMKLYENESIGVPSSHTCCSLDDIEDARNVALHLGMPYHVFNFCDDFCEKIIHKFVECYVHGLTPNPCIDCNRYMKFRKLFRRARALECDYVVTGHYARIEKQNGMYYLKKGLDERKDQSYVLYDMDQEQLAHTLFPLGEYHKDDVRKMAEKCGLSNARKADSQDICFVPDGDYAKVIEKYTGKQATPGLFRDMDGNVLGLHRGLIHYTIGQRHGLGIPGHEPWYVCRLESDENVVVLGKKQDLLKRDVFVREFHWIAGAPPENSIHACVKIRYRQQEKPAVVTPSKDGSVHILFDEPQAAITPGQSAVIYDHDTILGGGEIVL